MPSTLAPPYYPPPPPHPTIMLEGSKKSFEGNLMSWKHHEMKGYSNAFFYSFLNIHRANPQPIPETQKSVMEEVLIYELFDSLAIYIEKRVSDSDGNLTICHVQLMLNEQTHAVHSYTWTTRWLFLMEAWKQPSRQRYFVRKVLRSTFEVAIADAWRGWIWGVGYDSTGYDQEEKSLIDSCILLTL